MSLGVVIKGPEGIVLASDSRVTLTAEREGSQPLRVNFDNATKLLSFSKPHNYVSAVTYGVAVIGLRTAHSLIPEFEVKIEDKERLTVFDYSKKLSTFFLGQWKKVMPEDYAGPSIMFIIGGYDPGEAYGKVFLVDIPRNPEPIQQNPGEANFGMTWGGQLQIASRLIHGYDPVVDNAEIEKLGVTASNIEDGFKDADCVVVMNNHKSYKQFDIYELLPTMKKPSLFFDGWHIFIPEDVRKIEDVTYQGLGND